MAVRRNIRMIRDKQAASRLSLLQQYRQRYPHRLVRDKDKSPKPHELDALHIFEGNFASVPLSDSVEWFFQYRSDMNTFVAKFGGTILGE